ncbi:molybdenum cofactor sulfurase 3 [Chironomus tepperi]|uniref:molybdenum cofactor sulfurase 3 n=1 Tax=Chironomus tepperi TaxID=113505 RepID=UPI00391FA586
MELTTEFTFEEQHHIKNEFKRLKGTTYLDSAGSVLYGENQLKNVCDLLTHNFYPNPHTSKTSENLIDQVRLRILKHFHVNNYDDYTVIFTSNCTNGLKIVGETFQFDDNGSFYYQSDSHTSVLGLREIVNTKDIIPLSRNFFKEDCALETMKNSLIAFPAQCNFNGYKFPLKIIEKIHLGDNNYVLLDAAAYASSNDLDLNLCKADYVTVSFYKIFGYPTGLGALIVSKRGAEKLKKKYYGGGTVKIALTRENWHQKRDNLHEIYEDGTIPFLEIISLQSSFNYMENLLGDSFMKRISRHVFNLAKYFYVHLKSMKHYNNEDVAVLYHDTSFEDITTQSGIVNFNLKHANGSFIGFAEFASIAALHNLIVRTGCFCNPGSCQTFLNLTNEDLLKHFNAGHVCGDDNDLVDNIPTGSIRVSFGYMNDKVDAETVLDIIRKCYVQTEESSLDKTSAIKESESKNVKPVLQSIRIFPIKSCGPMIINKEWKITESGLQYDRNWMIINGDNGSALTQKHETKMCLIRPFVDETNNTLRLEFPYMDSIEIPLNTKGEEIRSASVCQTKVCGDYINGHDCGQQVAEWLSNALAINNLRLIRQNAEGKERKSGKIALANQAQFLLINKASVQWLMDQVEIWDYNKDVDNVIDRFRGNFVIENIEALTENSWKKIKIGESTFEVQGLCTRCQMICIDQSTGEKTAEPLRTIGKIFQGKTKFGIYLRLPFGLKEDCSNLVIKCGDEIVDISE